MKKFRPSTLTSKQVLGVSGLVICLMIGSLAGVPWLFADPYEASDYEITHGSAEQFNVDNEFSTIDSTPIEELSPPAQAVVEQGITEYRNSARESIHYNVKYCREEMPVCDEIKRPDEFTYSATTESDVYEVIETDDGLYRITHEGTEGADFSFDQSAFIRPMIISIVLTPVASVLALIVGANHFALTPQRGGALPQKVILGLATYGILLTVVGIVDPFLQMFYGFSFAQNFLGLGILLTWGILFVIGIWWILTEFH